MSSSSAFANIQTKLDNITMTDDRSCPDSDSLLFSFSRTNCQKLLPLPLLVAFISRLVFVPSVYCDSRSLVVDSVSFDSRLFDPGSAAAGVMFA